MGRKIPLSEVRKHKSPGDCWLVINDKVYDVSKFLEEHPGGEAILLQKAGDYATNPFEDVGHSTDARELMQQYEIGDVVEKEPYEKLNPWARSREDKVAGGGLLRILIPCAIALAAFTYYKFCYKA